MALLYLYVFENKTKGDGNWKGDEYYIYAPSKVEAEKLYKEWTGEDPEFIRRERW